ncbi:MAG: glycosyltransferase, partial [Deltaproteobacteria bacterium]|nr:glycosyltransferase [Deltaproteobacteria bacterium]
MPFYSSHNILSPIYAAIQHKADLTIVTNDKLSTLVKENGGSPFVLEDKIPHFRRCHPIPLKGDHNVVFVCSFEKDEPYLEIIQAARLIDLSISLYITGPYQKAGRDMLDQAPPNVVFTGFLSDQDYVDLLYSCDAVIDLTVMQNCLVCGAYEAVALGKPVILSGTEALKKYFSKGAVYTENRPWEIAAAIMHALKNRE